MSPSGETILVVDDDRDIRESLETCLRSEGYNVLTADDGQTALDMLNFGTSPAVILLDLMMPRLNGFEFLEQVKRSGGAGIPVVVLSANRGYEAVDLGVATVLRKPTSLEDLLDAIERAAA